MSAWQPAPDVRDQQPLAPGRTTSTWAIWVIALLPLLSIVSVLLQDPAGQMREAVTRGLRQAENPTVAPAVLLPTSGQLLGFLVSLVLLAVMVLLAVADHRALTRLGVMRPFHWAWAFLNPVYPIGRFVVVRRRVRGSLLPLWVWIATNVVGGAVVAVLVTTAMISALQVLR